MSRSAAARAAAAVLVLGLAGCSTTLAHGTPGTPGAQSRETPSESPTPTPSTPATAAATPSTQYPGSAAPPSSTATPAPSIPPTAASPSSPPAVVFDTSARSVDDPASIWVVVNKVRALNPVTFVPPDLVYPAVTYVNRQPMRREAADALVAMLTAARTEAGLSFAVQSAYRSYATQTAVYNDDVARNGRAYADADTARPGHSEHQTGLAIDLSASPARCSLAACLGTTPHGMWLAANAWRFGFLLRYPADKVAVTGFTYEPWHFRYIGTALAAELHRTGVKTLEEFFGLPGGTVYR